MVKAKCVNSKNPWPEYQTELIEGEFYEVSNISMGQSYTSIYLIGFKDGFNSVQFEFYEDDKPLDIYSDRRFNLYI